MLSEMVAWLAPSPEERRRRREEASWTTGAEGEEKPAQVLARRCPGVPMLHDARMPRSRANIDHIAFAPTGVYVIDTKRYSGKVKVVSSRRRGSRLMIDGRDRTKLIDGLHGQVELVSSLLAGVADDAPVHGCLCFVAPQGLFGEVGLPVLRTLAIDGYPLYYPRRLARRLNASGPITAATASTLQTAVSGQLRVGHP
jgi:hypothetical protein